MMRNFLSFNYSDNQQTIKELLSEKNIIYSGDYDDIIEHIEHGLINFNLQSQMYN